MRQLIRLSKHNKVGIARILVCLVFFILAFSLFNLYLNAGSNPDSGYKDSVEKRKVYAPRGAILDRRGYSLADNKLSRDIMAVRGRIDPVMINPISEFLAQPLSIDKSAIEQALLDDKFENPVKTGLTEEEFNKFCDFRYREWRSKNEREVLEKIYNSYPELKNQYQNLDDFERAFHKAFSEIIPRKNYPRFYPAGPVTAQLIGYSSEVQRDFNAHKGIELEYNNILNGVDGYVIEWLDAFRRPIPGLDSREYGVVPGLNLRLTVSTEMQTLAYRVLEERVKETNAAGGCIIIMDSATGEILTMVSYPSFDPYNYQEELKDAPQDPSLLPPDEYRLNPEYNLGIQIQYEQGSVMKPVLASWALKNGIITTDDVFEISPDGLHLPGKTIHDTHPPPSTEMWKIRKILVNSSNQGMGQVGLRMSREEIIDAFKAFGFGRKALDFHEELAGNINENRAHWEDVERANAAFGQGISVTPLQMTAAMNVFANGGNYVKPKITLDATSADGDVQFYKTNERVQIIPPDTLAIMLDALEGVVLEGTGVPAQCPGYRVAGKTGTAQKWDRLNKCYSNDRHYACFAGFGPLPDPKFTIFVMLDQPHPKWGGSSCGPAFKVIFQNLMIMEGIPPIEDWKPIENATKSVD